MRGVRKVVESSSESSPQIRKISTIIILIFVTVAVLGLRWQIPDLSIPAMIAILLLMLLTKSMLATIGLGVTLILLYPSSQMGWLYARGSHIATRNSYVISSVGWPLPDSTISFARGFTDTPALHFLTVFGSRITSLDILPATEGKVLIGALLGLHFAAITVLITGCLVRRYLKKIKKTVGEIELVYALIPILAWLPFFRGRTVFARRNLALVLFSAFVFLLYQNHISPSKRTKFLVIICASMTVLTHHLTAFIVIIVLSIYVIYYSAMSQRLIYLKHLFQSQSRLSLVNVTLLSGIIFVSWHFLLTEGGLELVILGVKSLSLLESSTSGSVASPQVQPNSGLSTIKIGWFLLYQKFFGVYLFLGVLGLFTTISAALVSHSDGDNGWSSFCVTAGLVIGLGTVASWLTSLGIRVRIGTFFVLLGGWLAPVGVSVLANKNNLRRVNYTHALAVILIILGGTLIQPYVFGHGAPPFSQGQTDQRFPSTFYAAGTFIGTSVSDNTTLVGDENIEHILIATTGRKTHNSPLLALGADTQPDAIKVMTYYNDELYFGGTSRYGRFATSPGISPPILEPSNKMYDNGDVIMWR